MASLPQSATRLSAPALLAFCVATIALALLLGKQLDALWAGGTGAGPHSAAVLVAEYPSQHSPGTSPSPLLRGETITTNANTFATYALNTCTISLAENTSLILSDGRVSYNAFSFLTGRVVTFGNCTLRTRETTVTVTGVATLVHFSWLDELVVHVLEGSASIDQSGVALTLTPDSSPLRFFTLPSVSHHEPSTFSFTDTPLIENFYTWSLPSSMPYVRKP